MRKFFLAVLFAFVVVAVAGSVLAWRHDLFDRHSLADLSQYALRDSVPDISPLQTELAVNAEISSENTDEIVALSAEISRIAEEFEAMRSSAAKGDLMAGAGISQLTSSIDDLSDRIAALEDSAEPNAHPAVDQFDAISETIRLNTQAIERIELKANQANAKADKASEKADQTSVIAKAAQILAQEQIEGHCEHHPETPKCEALKKR